ncbi:MAG: glycosyltransferase family 9 protein [Ignavibacteriaceae bacterium]|nr:glycosyltransferase family 9 protein [Ignavibacteriaceae bacterium]
MMKKEKLYPIPSCKNFNGYKPCFPDHNCWEHGCKENKPMGKKILIINLDAMGDVLMTTAQLKSIKKKFPESSIFWITLKPADQLLMNNPYVDQVFKYDFESLSILQQMEFEYAYNIDKSQRSASLLNSVSAKHKLGFGLNTDGKIIPLNNGAFYNYQLGMDNHLKFKVNQRTGQDYLSETLELDYERNDYVYQFSDEELEFQQKYKNEVGLEQHDLMIGFNTGCSNLFPNKKMTVEQHIQVIEQLLNHKKFKILLFGGPEDTKRNEQIAQPFGDKIINTPTTMGLRRGVCFENLADLIITGDSFGMHIAIALKKYVIAWFGLSCWTEIDLYDRGVKLYPKDLFCSPCWKKSCPYGLECVQQIDLKRIENEVANYFDSKAKQ